MRGGPPPPGARTRKWRPPSSETAPARQPDAPGPRKRVDRRERIPHTAAEVFAAQGFHNTSLADIAATPGITPAGVLHHFGSRTGLLTAVSELRDGTPPAPEGADLLDHLVITAEHNAATPGTTQLYAVLSAESATDRHPAQGWFRDRHTALRHEIAAAVLERIGPNSGKRPRPPARTGTPRPTTSTRSWPGCRHGSRTWGKGIDRGARTVSLRLRPCPPVR